MPFSISRAKLTCRSRCRREKFFRPQLESLEELTLLSAGSLDPTFGMGGEILTDFTLDRQVSREALQPDGKIVVVGSMSNAPLSGYFSVARFNADGSPDLSFGKDGLTSTNFFNGDAQAYGVVLQSDVKIVVVGDAYNQATGLDFAVARFNSDGTLDASFGSSGQVTTDLGGGHDYATSVVIQPDGKIVVAGGGGVNTKDQYAMARYNPDGSLDSSFGDGGKVLADFSNRDPIVTDRFIALQADGKILMAGNYAPDTPGSNQDFLVARFNPDGTLDTTFGAGGVALIAFDDDSAQYNLAQSEGLMVQGDSKIVVLGTVEANFFPYGNRSAIYGGYSAIALARLNPDGTLDQTFGTGGKVTTIFGSLGASVNGAVLQPDGAIVVVGNLDANNQLFYLDLVRYTGNGQLDPTFGNGGQSLISFSGEGYFAKDIALESDGKFLVVADNHGYRSHANFMLAQFLGGANPVPGPYLTATGIPLTSAEGQPFSGQVASFTDPDSTAQPSDFTATIDWGDTSSSVGTIIQPGGPGTSFFVSGDHAWPDEGIHFLRVTITTKTGDTFFATAQVTINDAPLTAMGIPVMASAGVPFSGPVATITDANPNATGGDFYFSPPFTAVVATPHYWIDWGDGTTSGATLTGGMGSPFVLSGNHTYLVPGSYTIKATIEDYGGNSATATTTATVTNASHIVGRAIQTGQIWVGVSTGSSFNSSLWTTWSPGANWVDVLTGDFNGDGLTDIAARDANTGAWWVALSTGSSFTTTLWDTWSTHVTWTDVQVGDFNGDGKMDIIGRPVGEGHWWVGVSTGSSFTTSLWETWSAVTWVDVKVGDFNGDGKADITGRDLGTGAWWTGVSTGSSFKTGLWAIWSTAVTWVDVQVGDFDGDGKLDITGRVEQTGDWWTGISMGSGFQTSRWATWSTGVTWVDVHVGDFNGDGRSDIIGRALETGEWWVGLSTALACQYHPPFCLIVSQYPVFNTTLWSTWSTGVTWVDVQVGDFNGDGKADITGRALETGQWWTGLSNGSAFTTSLWATWSTGVTWTGVRSGDFA